MASVLFNTDVTITGALTVTGLSSGQLQLAAGGTYQAGRIYSDANWGMIFRALQATPVGADFLFSNSADVNIMRLKVGTAGATTALMQLYSPRQFSTTADGLILFGNGGTAGTHDYGAVFMGHNTATGDGGAGAFELRVGGTSSASNVGRFIRAIANNGTGGAAKVSFYTGNTERAYIDASGTVASTTVLHAMGATTYLPLNGQGTYIGWNKTGGGGCGDFICHKGGGAGGFDWWNGDGTTQTLLMQLKSDQLLYFKRSVSGYAGAWYEALACSAFVGSELNANLFRIYSSWGSVGNAVIVDLTNGSTSVNAAIGAGDNLRTGIRCYDTTAMAADVGGQLVLGYKYHSNGTYTEGAIIRSYKEDGGDGYYGSGLKIQVRNHGANFSTKMTLDPSGNLTVNKSYLSSDVYALAAVNTAAQTRTLDISNGAVQTITADQSFTLDMGGPAGSAGFVWLYIWNSSGGSITAGSGANGHGSNNASSVPTNTTGALLFFWNGTRGIRIFNYSGSATGNILPT